MKIKIQKAKNNQEQIVDFGAEEINSAQLNIKKRNRLIQQKGVSLLTLLMTIIFLLILAGVTINLTIGEDGIFKKTKDAEEKYNISAYTERIELARGSVRNKKFRASNFR